MALINYLYDYINDTFNNALFPSNQLRYMYHLLCKEFQPDINGYTLLFMIPPDLSGYRKTQGSGIYAVEGQSFFTDVQKLVPFAAIDFTPPQVQVNTESIESRTGGIPYATEVSPTTQISVTYVDDKDLKIYNMHSIWIRYIKAVTEGLIEPDSKYYEHDSEHFGVIDYAAAFYIVKFLPDMNQILFVAKCIGCFPQNLPNKELIGQRQSNELTTLPFTYFCSGYYEALHTEPNHWVINELLSFFT